MSFRRISRGLSRALALAVGLAACSHPKGGAPSASASTASAALCASVAAPSASAVAPPPRAASRLLPPLDAQHLGAWAREADERIPDDGYLASPPPRGDRLWVSWPLPIAALPRRVFGVVTCRTIPEDKERDPKRDATHVRGACRLWAVDFGAHEWASAPIDLPTRPRDLGSLEPIDRDADREIAFLMGDTGTAFLDTLSGWPPASRGWDSARANAHRLGELLARTLTPELMHLYWEADGRFFRWAEIAAELDVMGRGGRYRPCAKKAPETFDRDGLAPLPLALAVPTRRDGCLRLTRPILSDAAREGPAAWILPPRFVLDVDPDALSVTAFAEPETFMKSLPPPALVERHEATPVAARVAGELPHVMALFLRRGPLSGDERDAALAYEADLFTLVDRALEPIYRAIAPDFFKWLDEVRDGKRTPL